MYRLFSPAVLLAVFSLFQQFQTANAQKPDPKVDFKKGEPKIDAAGAIKWDLGVLEKHLEKEFSVKIKSSSLVDMPGAKGKTTKGIKLLLEFGKDLDTTTLSRMDQIFQTPSGVTFLLYDDENVLFGQASQSLLSARTGVKGDAYRVFVESQSSAPWEKTKRIAVRMPAERKTKGDK